MLSGHILIKANGFKRKYIIIVLFFHKKKRRGLQILTVKKPVILISISFG